MCVHVCVFPLQNLILHLKQNRCSLGLRRPGKGPLAGRHSWGRTALSGARAAAREAGGLRGGALGDQVLVMQSTALPGKPPFEFNFTIRGIVLTKTITKSHQLL